MQGLAGLARSSPVDVKSAVNAYKRQVNASWKPMIIAHDSVKATINGGVEFALVVDLGTLAKNREQLLDSSCRKVLVADSKYRLDLCCVPVLDDGDNMEFSYQEFKAWMEEDDGELSLPTKSDILSVLNTNNHIMSCLEGLGNSVTKMTLSLTMACASNSTKNKVKRKFVDWMLTAKTSTKALRSELSEHMDIDAAQDILDYLETGPGRATKAAAAKFGKALRTKKEDALTKHIESDSEDTGLTKFDMRYIRASMGK